MLVSKDIFLEATTFNDIMAHSHLKRYHTEHTMRTQNLAEHCFRVTLIAVKWLYEYHSFLCTKDGAMLPQDWNLKELELETYRYALLHEVSEIDTGDIPSHVKWHLRETHNIDINKIVDEKHWADRGIAKEREVTPVVKALVSLADTMEGKMFASGQIPCGKVRHSVLADWDRIWDKKVAMFSPYVKYEFLRGLGTDYYRTDLGVDAAWK